MPPYKQPSLLRDLALRQTADLIEDTCKNISRNNLLSITCYFKALRLRDYLVSNIYPFIDELCWYIFTREREAWVAGEVVFWIFMNRHTKHLNLTHQWTRSVCHDVPLHKGFWGTHLCKVPNLIEFHFETNIPSELFGILGKYCHHLEIIKFRFRGTNAIEKLKTIKSLRIIKNTIEGYRYFDTRRDLFCTLLQSLPKLEYINSCSCMGEILASMEDVSNLNLMHVCDAMPTLKGVESIVKLCKSLKSLTLGNHSTLLSNHFKNLITPVTESALEISNLELSSFEFSTSLQELFHKKGKFIKSLTLQNLNDSSTYKCLITIGTYCHHLEDLNIYDLKFDPEIYQHTPYHGPESIFKKLIKFTFHGVNPIPVQICLISAKNIQSISVSAEYWNIEDGDTGDLLTTELISKNPMNELQSLCMDFSASGFVLSPHLIQHLFCTLPKLVKLDLLSMVYEPKLEECLQSLSDHIASSNIDLSFQYSFNDKPTGTLTDV